MDDRKLTKKQKKGLAFRQGKRKAKEQDDLPIADVVDVEEEVQPAAPAEVRTKRKRDDGEAPAVKTKKRKAESGGVAAAVETGEGSKVEEEGESKKKANNPARRFILFVGNLPKDVTSEKISSHFASCPTPPTVRLRTPAPAKASLAKSPAGRPKIFAFLEFQDAPSLQAALKLHRSNLGGKLINVELTVGGGGKGENRKEKIKAKIAAAREQDNKESQIDAQQADAQRPRSDKPGAGRDGRHKGAAERKPRPIRPMGTGVNAIPVG